MTETTENTVEDIAAEEVAVESSEVAPEAEATADDVVVETTDDVEKSDDVEVTADAEEAATVTEDADEATSDATTEVEADVEKAEDVTVLVSEIKDGIASAFSDLTAVVKSLNDELAEIKKSIGGVETRLNAVSTDVNTVKSDFNEFGKRVDAVEADTAFRKSGDLGEIVQDSQIEKSDKSPWGGRFLKTADLFR
jgi:chromosome segregation ATPase